MQQRGFTLVELMISMVLGLLILGALAALFTSSLSANNQILAQARVKQDLRALMAVMEADIRRAGGYRLVTESSGQALNNAFMQEGGNSQLSVSADKRCILFTYDLFNEASAATAPEAREYMGYRLKDGSVEQRQGSGSCSDDSVWHQMTDIESVVVERLEFELNRYAGAGSMAMQTVAITLAGKSAQDNSDKSIQLETQVQLRNLHN